MNNLHLKTFQHNKNQNKQQSTSILYTQTLQKALNINLPVMDNGSISDLHSKLSTSVQHRVHNPKINNKELSPVLIKA